MWISAKLTEAKMLARYFASHWPAQPKCSRPVFEPHACRYMPSTDSCNTQCTTHMEANRARWRVIIALKANRGRWRVIIVLEANRTRWRVIVAMEADRTRCPIFVNMGSIFRPYTVPTPSIYINSRSTAKRLSLVIIWLPRVDSSSKVWPHRKKRANKQHFLYLFVHGQV